MRRFASDEVVVTFLEMNRAPELPIKHLSAKPDIVRVHHMPVHFYRYLYETIGRDHMWIDRARMSDPALSRLIHSPDIELYVLYVDGAPQGYAELNFQDYPDVELVHFGLVPEATGCGLGRYFLSDLISQVWARSPNRFHVQTCTLDHPAALPLYRDCGFVPFETVVKRVSELV